MNTHSLSELDGILKRSEAHALKCTIDRGITYRIYEEQIRTGYLTISATTKMVKKAIQLFDMFVRRMYKEGFSLILDYTEFYHCPASAIIVDGEKIPVRVKEKHDVKKEGEGILEHKVLVPSGRLVIELYGGIHWNLSKTLVKPIGGNWKDVIETCIPYLHKAASQIREHRLYIEEQARERDEEERIRKEHKKMIMDKASVVKAVLNDAWLYERAQVIRRYCDYAEQVVDSEEYKEELVIARRAADWIDPTMDYEDELLSEMFSPEDFLT